MQDTMGIMMIISMDANGISDFEYDRDSLHRIVRVHFLDNNYEYRSNNIGVAGKNTNTT